MNLDAFKKRAARDERLQPRFHSGIGMIQVLKSKHERLHVWHPELEKTRPGSSIHNHKFSFSSRILKGYLHNVYHAVIDGNTYNLWRTHQDAGAEADLIGTCDLAVVGHQAVRANQEYFVEAGRFHETHVMSGILVTYIKKMWTCEQMPVMVVAQKDVEMSHAYSSKLKRPTVDEMWEIVADATGDIDEV